MNLSTVCKRFAHSTNKTWVIHAFFLFILIVGFSIRLVRFGENYQFNSYDSTRDYLMAHHIILYKEYPQFGPENGVYSQLPNSPFYYYFIAGLLLSGDNIHVFAYWNIVFQFVSIIALYGFAWTLFGPYVAIFTGTLTTLSQQYIDQTFIFWQPTISMPFFYVSYFLLAYGYKKKNILVIFIGAISYTITFGLGFYGVAGLPIILGLIWVSLRRTNASFFSYITIFGSIIGLTAIFYIPVIRYLWQTHQQFFFLHAGSYVQWTGYIPNIFITMHRLFEGFIPLDRLAPINTIFISVGLLLFIPYYFSRARGMQRRYGLVLCLSIVLTILAAALAPESPPWHLVSVVGLMIILVVQMLTWLFHRKGLATSFSIVGIIVLFLLTIIGPSYLHRIFTINIAKTQEDAAGGIVSGLEEVKKQYGPSWPTFFKIVTYDIRDHDSSADKIFWPFLEKMTQTKLTKYMPFGTYPRNFMPLGTHEDYLIIICTNYDSVTHAHATCLPKFQAQFPRHTIEKMLYDGDENTYIIYLAHANK